MIVYAGLALAGAVFLVGALGSARAVLCNARRLRAVRRAAPLDGLDLSGATVTPVPTARGWPRVEELTDPSVAAAYASLADDRMVTGAVIGEFMVVAAGAAMGGVILDLLDGGWAPRFGALGAFAVTMFGIAYRFRATRLWAVRAARYRARYRVLTASPAPVVTAPPASWLDRLLGRLSRSRGTR